MKKAGLLTFNVDAPVKETDWFDSHEVFHVIQSNLG